MIRPVCLRAFALFPIVLAQFTGTGALAGQSEPAAQRAVADRHAASTTRSADSAQTSGADAQPPSPNRPIPQSPAAQPGQGPTPQIQTPAQTKYGLPHNPIVGGPVDIDLTKPLTLERAIRIGLQRQNSIAIAKAQRDASNQRVVEARSSYFPQIVPSFQFINTVGPFINGSLTGTGTGTFSNGTTGSVGVAPLSLGSGRQASVAGSTSLIQSGTLTEAIGASFLLLDSGQRAAGVGFARRNLFASEYNLGEARQNVIEAVTNDYYTLLRDRELVRVQQKNLDLAQTTLDAIVAEFQAGAAAQSDTLQAQSNLANARVLLLQAQNTAYVDEASLKNAMGVVTSQPLAMADENTPAPSPTPDPRGLDDYVSLAYNARLDLKQQQELVNAQGYNVKIAQINAGISVNATVNEGYQLDPASGETRSFVVAISYPLFDGYRTRATVYENKAILEEQRRQLDLEQQTVRLQVEQDYLTREVSRQQVVAANVAVQAGQTNYDAALEKQRNGLINILDVLNAQVQLLTAQVSQVNAIYNFYIADSALQHDIGQNDPNYSPNVPRVRQAGPTRKSGSAAPGTGSAPLTSTATAQAVPAIAPTAVANASEGRKP